MRRHWCTVCGDVWRLNMTRTATPPAKVLRRGLGWALEGIVCQDLTGSRAAEGLGVSGTPPTTRSWPRAIAAGQQPRLVRRRGVDGVNEDV